MIYGRHGINLDITHRCTLQCPACPRYFYKKNNIKVPGYDMSDIEFDIILNYFEYIRFCGNISDPVFHPRFHKFLEKVYLQKKKAIVHTSASHKKMDWYKTAFKSNINARWKFGIDGLPHQSSTYRINQDGEKMFDIMLMCNEMGIETVWQYIIFSYNQDNIEEAKQLAKKHNVNIEFMITHRVGRDHEWLRPRDEYTIKF